MNIGAAHVELAEAKKAVRAARRAFAKSPDSAFVRTMRTVIADYLKAREQGITREEGIRGIEAALREVWPKNTSRFTPNCDVCDDIGWAYHQCVDGNRCGRESCARNPEREHSYVTPCYCAKGERFRARPRQVEDELAAVGKTQKKRGGFSRVGA